MSINKFGRGMDYYYNSELFGNGSAFNNNPAAKREQLIETNLRRNLIELALNRFCWENLPKSIDARFLEICMLFNGMVVWYKDKKFDELVAVRGSAQGYVNFLDNPVSFTVIGPGGTIMGESGNVSYTPKTLSAYIPQSDYKKSQEDQQKKAIGMYPNYLRVPELDTIILYSTKIAKLDHTIEINAANARVNKVITASPNTQLSAVNFNRQIIEGVDGIQLAGNARPEDIVTTVDFGIDPRVHGELASLRTRHWNDCMTMLGIDSANQDKKERLVADEVSANDSQADSMRYVALNARQQAVDMINEVFGENIKVSYNAEVEKQAEQMQAESVENDSETDSEDDE